MHSKCDAVSKWIHLPRTCFGKVEYTTRQAELDNYHTLVFVWHLRQNVLGSSIRFNILWLISLFEYIGAHSDCNRWELHFSKQNRSTLHPRYTRLHLEVFRFLRSQYRHCPSSCSIFWKSFVFALSPQRLRLFRKLTSETAKFLCITNYV